MAGAPPCRALSFMTHRILYLYRGCNRGEGESGRGLRGAEWRGGYLCASLVCVWCLDIMGGLLCQRPLYVSAPLCFCF